MMKYMNDPKLLAKLGTKLGDLAPGAPDAGAAAPAAAPAAAAPAAAAEPEINNLRDAA